MSWLVDNANIWYVLAGMVALSFGTAWWLRRRTGYLLGMAAAIGIIVIVGLLTRLVVTDRQQLELNVRAMAGAVVEGKANVLFKHLASDFEFQGRKREDLAEGAARGAKQYQVFDIVISSFEVEELTQRSAKVFFRATVHSRSEDRPYPFACRGIFAKENDRWKLKEIRLYNPLVNQNQPITLPIP